MNIVKSKTEDALMKRITRRSAIVALCLPALLMLNVVSFAAEGVQKISIEQAKDLHEQGAVFVDTRSWLEMKFGMVKDAIAINKNDVTEQAPQLINDKQQAIVTYCAVGVRASVAAENFSKLGYSNVYVISDAGFSEWKEAGYPLETE